MDKFKAILRNKIVIRSLLVVAVAGAGVALSDDQVDKLSDVVVMLLSLLG